MDDEKKGITLYLTHSSNLVRNAYDAIGQCLNLGGEWVFSIKPNKTTRSQAQNRLYWLWIDIISEHRNAPIEAVHRGLKLNFLGVRSLKKPQKVRQYDENGNFQGIVTVDFEPISTTELNTQQFSEYLEQIDAWAAQKDIILPIPNYAQEYYLKKQ